MPRSFLIKKKTTDAAVVAAGLRKAVDLSVTSSCDDFVTSTGSMEFPVRDNGSDDAVFHFRSGSPEETITDKNGNNTKTLKTKQTSSSIEFPKGNVSSTNTVLPAPRRLTIWSPAADVKAEVDAAAAAEMALKLVAKVNGIDKDTLGSLSSLVGINAARSGVGCFFPQLSASPRAAPYVPSPNVMGAASAAEVATQEGSRRPQQTSVPPGFNHQHHQQQHHQHQTPVSPQLHSHQQQSVQFQQHPAQPYGYQVPLQAAQQASEILHRGLDGLRGLLHSSVHHQIPFPVSHLLPGAPPPFQHQQPGELMGGRRGQLQPNDSSTDGGSFKFSPKSSISDSEQSENGNRNSATDSNLALRPSATSSSSSSSSSRRCSRFQEGITVGYTYDAFFVSDGRSRRRGTTSSQQTTAVPAVQPAAAVGGAAAPAAGFTAAGGLSESAATGTSGNHVASSGSNRQRYRCAECGKHYATSSNLSRHKQTHRSLNSQQAKHCPHCGKVYVSMPALSMHVLTHDLKYSCTVCDKAFSRPWLLQGHLRSHTGEKPFGCAHCGKAFADRSNLRAHMQTHSAFKLYACKRCGKSFALKAYLNKHHESACLRDDGRVDPADCPNEIDNDYSDMSNASGSVRRLPSCDGADGDVYADDMDENCTRSSLTSIWSV